MTLDLSKVYKRLENMKRKETEVDWKMNVKIPTEHLFGASECASFDDISKLVMEAVEEFSRETGLSSSSKNASPHFTLTFQGTNYQFSIYAPSCEIIDDRGKYKEKIDQKDAVLHVRIGVNASLKDKENMLVNQPLEFSFSGQLTRTKHDKKVNKVVFTSLIVTDGITHQYLISIQPAFL